MIDKKRKYQKNLKSFTKPLDKSQKVCYNISTNKGVGEREDTK